MKMGSMNIGVSRAMANGDVNIFDQLHHEQIKAAANLLEVMIVPSHLLKITDGLFARNCIGVEIAAEIGQLIRNRNRDNEKRAWEIFLDNIPKFSEEWYWEFMTLLSDTAENRDVRDSINALYEEELSNRNAARQAAVSASESCVVESSAAGTSHGDYEEPKLGTCIREDNAKLTILEVRHSFEDWLDGNLEALANAPKYESDESDDEDLEPEALILRNYQHELARNALTGKNTIIVAPTGSGKTLVAVEIVKRHLEAGGSNKKVAFLVPTVNLIDQQTRVFKRYLRQSFRVKGIRGGQSGMKQLPKALVVRSNNVLIMTPQILLNLMNDPTPDIDPIEMELFTLLIFDECHHCDKGHPYNEIMETYLDRKLSAIDSARPALPQVVGMTASLGVGGANSTPQAREYVLSVCARMDASMLSTVVNNQDEMLEHVSVPVDDLEQVSSNYYTHPFSIHVSNAIYKIEKDIIIPSLDQLDKSETASARPKYSTSFDPPPKKHMAAYRSWVCSWMHELPTCQDIELKRKLISAFEHLEMYHTALFLNGHVPTRLALDYITQRSVEFERHQRSEIDKELVKRYRDVQIHFNNGGTQNESNPMVEKLKQIILREFEARPDGRALVFVATRELTIALMQFMNGDPELQPFGAARLTGVQASKAKGGQSASEQVAILTKFRSGEHRVLIVTSVAEEGLDVAKCNLIIKYNHVSDEISMVQRRGRGRAAGSRSILLVQDGWMETKEMANMIRERMMMQAVDYIGNMGSQWYNDHIRRRQRIAYENREMEKTVVDTTRRKLQGNTCDLKCKKCSEFIICSTNIRRIGQSHYVGVDPSIWGRIEAEADDAPKIFENMAQAGRLFCKNCRTECGNVIKYVCVYLPALGGKDFIQESREGTTPKQIHHLRKWKAMTEQLFFVEAITRQDLREMFLALKLKSEPVFKVLEERIENAERIQEEKRRQQQVVEEEDRVAVESE